MWKKSSLIRILGLFLLIMPISFADSFDSNYIGYLMNISTYNNALLADTYINYQEQETDTGGASNIVNVRFGANAEGRNSQSYFMVNTTNLHGIEDKGDLKCDFIFYVQSEEANRAYDIFYHNSTWDELSYASVNGTGCGVNVSNIEYCNSSSSGQYYSNSLAGWKNVTITPTIKRAVSDRISSTGESNVSLALVRYTYDPDATQLQIYSKEQDTSYSVWVNCSYSSIEVNSSFSNYENFNNVNYVRTLNYSINISCYSPQVFNISLFSDYTLLDEFLLDCSDAVNHADYYEFSENLGSNFSIWLNGTPISDRLDDLVADLTNPTQENDLNDNTYVAYQNITYNINLSDNYRLYSINVTNPEGYEVYVSNINATTYIFNGSFYPLGYPTGTQSINITYCDESSYLEEDCVTEQLNYTLRESLAICGNFTNTSAINFTLYDEETGSLLHGDISGTFNYGSYSLSINEVNVTNVSICIYPTNVSVSGDYEITYSSSGYSERSYTDSSTVFNNNTQSVILYLLSDTSVIVANFGIIDEFNNPLDEVLVIMKTLSGTVIESRYSDSRGAVSFLVNPDDTYTFEFSKTGYEAETYNLRITNTDIIPITLTSESEDDYISLASGISYHFYPKGEILNNNTGYVFNFNLTSNYWNLTGCTFTIKNNSDILITTSCFYNSTYNNASITFNVGNQSFIFAEATYTLNNTYSDIVSRSYRVRYTYEGDSSLKNFLDDITSFAESGFGYFERFLLSLIIILLVTGFISLNSSEFREPEILIPTIWILTTFFSYLGWMYLPLDTLPSNIAGLPDDWLKQWVVWILITLLGGTYILRKHIT